MRRVGFPAAFRGERWQHISNRDIDVPSEFTGRGRWISGPMHTFVDDYRQEFFWRRPEEGLLVALTAGVATAPDFTIYRDDPVEWQMFQSFRSVRVGQYWAAYGVNVLPVVSFHEHALAVAPGCTWAIRGPRVGDEDQWWRGVRDQVARRSIARLVVFGRQVEKDLMCEVVHRNLQSSSK